MVQPSLPLVVLAFSGFEQVFCPVKLSGKDSERCEDNRPARAGVGNGDDTDDEQ